MARLNPTTVCSFLLFPFFFVSCGWFDAPTYTIGGTVSGLSGSVVLQNNGDDGLTVSSNGAFVFGTALAAGAAYDVRVITHPDGQTCEVANGSGTIAKENVTNVEVTCIAVFSFGGATTGASPSGLTLKNTSSSSIDVTSFYLSTLDIGSTSPCFASILGSSSNAFGALWASITVPAGGTVAVGQNFLYNSMMDFLYQAATIVGPMPVDTPGGTDAWCVKIGLSSGAPVCQTCLDSSPLVVDTITSTEVFIQCDDLTASCTATPVEQIFPM